MAGKTGTAQVVAIGAVRLKKEQMSYFERDHAWFAGFAPADEPEIAVVVLNEHGGHGGVDAAPTAMAVIQKYFELKSERGSPPHRAASAANPGAYPSLTSASGSRSWQRRRMPHSAALRCTAGPLDRNAAAH